MMLTNPELSTSAGSCASSPASRRAACLRNPPCCAIARVRLRLPMNSAGVRGGAGGQESCDIVLPLVNFSFGLDEPVRCESLACESQSRALANTQLSPNPEVGDWLQDWPKPQLGWFRPVGGHKSAHSAVTNIPTTAQPMPKPLCQGMVSLPSRCQAAATVLDGSAYGRQASAECGEGASVG